MKLNTLTKKDIKDCNDNPTLQDQLIEQLYSLAGSFIKQHVIYCYNYDDNQDYVQDLVIKAWKNLNKFDETKANFCTFCYYSWCNEYKRRLASNKILTDQLDIDIKDETSTPLEKIISEERINIISKLKKNQKLIFYKYIVENKKQNVIAKEMNRTTQCINHAILKSIDDLKDLYAYY